MFGNIFLASLIAVVSGQARPPLGGCLVCGNDSGNVVGNPDAVFAYPGQPNTTCGVLQEAGLSGAIPLSQCPFLPPLVADCGCEPGDLPSTTAPFIAAVPPPGGCLICGDDSGSVVGNPDAIFSYPGQTNVTCADLQSAGLSGLIPLDQCPFLPPLVTDCGCEEGPLPIVLATPPEGGCLVCGDDSGSVVGNPDAIFSYPGQQNVTCADLQQAGLTGAIPLDQCPFLPPLLSDCGCEPGPLPAVLAVPPEGGCLVCGPGSVVGNPDAIFSYPGQPNVTCTDLQTAGLTGAIPLDQCPFLAPLLSDCGCEPGALPLTDAPDTAAPVTAPPVVPPVATPAPVVPPTLAPVAPPTPAPVPPPTAAPVVPPTAAPVPPPTAAPVPPPTAAPVPPPTAAPVPPPTPRPVVPPTAAPVPPPTTSPVITTPVVPPTTRPVFVFTPYPVNPGKMGMLSAGGGMMGKRRAAF